MKILREGGWYNDPWVSRETCSRCLALVEVEESDVFPFISMDAVVHPQTAAGTLTSPGVQFQAAPWWRCPSCGRPNMLPIDRCPSWALG